MIQMLCAILGRLNGQPISASPLDSPSMHAAVTPRACLAMARGHLARLAPEAVPTPVPPKASRSSR